MEKQIKKTDVKKRWLISIFLFLLVISNAVLLKSDDSQGITFKNNIIIEELDFENQNIQDIFQTFAKIMDITIIVNKDINYTKSYHFRNISAQELFSVLLNDNNLEYKIVNSVVYITKKLTFSIEVSNDLISVSAQDSSMLEIIYKVFVRLNKVIMFKNLDDKKINLDLIGYSLKEFVDFMGKEFNLDFKEIKNGYLISQKQTESNVKLSSKDLSKTKGLKFSREKGLYYIEAEEVNLSDILQVIFLEEGLDYSILIEKEIKIKQLKISGKNFNDLVKILEERYYFSCLIENNFATVYSSLIQNNILSKKIVLYYTLRYFDVKKLNGYLPKEVSLFDGLYVNLDLNSVLLFGYPQDVLSILNLIKSIDQNNASQIYYFHLNYIDIEEFKKIMPVEFKNLEIMYMDKYNSILVKLSKEQVDRFDGFLKVADVFKMEYRIQLNNLTMKDFKQKMPDEYKKYIISENEEGNFFIVKAPYKIIINLIDFINLIDVPSTLIKYNILIVQTMNDYNESFIPEWGSDFSVFDTDFWDTITEFVSTPTFDAFSNFGKYFSFKLNWAISNNKAFVSANSELYAMNNSEIEFNNSSTFRYKEQQYDEDTGTWVDVGVIREIGIGFFLTLTGYYNASGEIIIDLSGKISRVTNISEIENDSSVLPMTTDKEIKVKLKIKSHEPILAASFTEEYDDINETKVPILGYIPLIGKLFTKTVTQKQKINFFIYILPEAITKNNQDNLFQSIYNHF